VKNIHVDVDSLLPPSTNDSAIFNYMKLKYIFFIKGRS